MIRSVQFKVGGIIMKKKLSLLATLALAATLSPATFAQQDQTPQPGAAEPQTQTAPAPDSSNSDSQMPKSFSGTVVKMQKQYVLKTDSATYQLDDQVKAKHFSGKQVTVSGILDQSTSMIRVSDIQPAS
jgi:Protein of unknown function (DUF5818)